MSDTREEVFFASRQDLRGWLAEHFARPAGVWAVFHKKSSGLSDLSWEAIVEECLCFGWIDSLPGKVDETRTKIYISPRKTNSGWSRRNKALVIDLHEWGMMESPGSEVIKRAQSNGSWERFDLAEGLVVPAELEMAFSQDEDFLECWNALSDARKRQFLQQFYDAKTDSTRQKRIDGLRVAIC